MAEPREGQVSWVLDALLEALGTLRTPSSVLPRDRIQDESGRVLTPALGSSVGKQFHPLTEMYHSFLPLCNTGDKSQSSAPVTYVFIAQDNVAESSKNCWFPSLLQNAVGL